MSITKKGCLLLICSCLIFYSALCSALTNDEEKPYLYVIYDSTESMENAKSAIADLLGSIKQNVGPTSSWRWDFDGDGQFDDLGTFVSKTYDKSGEFIVKLELSNNDIPAVVRNLHLPVKVVE